MYLFGKKLSVSLLKVKNYYYEPLFMAHILFEGKYKEISVTKFQLDPSTSYRLCPCGFFFIKKGD